MAKRIKMDTDDEIVYRTSKLYQRHKEIIQYIEENRLSVTAGELADKYPNINEILSGLDKKYEYGNEIFTVLAPHCIEDILKEGQALHHCIDKKTEYLERINEQETYILFLRKTEQPDKPYYTLEVEPGGVIRQKRTEYDRQNKDIEEASEFLKEWQREIQKRITASDKKLADKSRQLRIESYAEMRKKKVKINGGLFQGKYLADVLEADLMEMPDTFEHAA
ncbi:MAG: PcfJ domain-containing protein [Blautia wexlerae]